MPRGVTKASICKEIQPPVLATCKKQTKIPLSCSSLFL